MSSSKWHKNIISYLMVLGGLIYLFSLRGSTAGMAQNGNAFVRQVRAMESDVTGLSNPAGLAFTPGANAFYAIEAPGAGQPPAETDIVKLTPFGDRAGSAQIAAAIMDPINTAFDSQWNRLLIFQAPNNMLIEVRADPDGNLDPRTLIRHPARHFDLQNPQGMAVDTASGNLFILDASGPRILRIEPEPDGSFDNAVFSVVELTSIDLVDPRGLAFDPTTGHLLVIDPGEQELYELIQTGQVVTTRDLSTFQFGDPQSLVFAPSGDQTDDPGQMSLYLADRGHDVGGQDQGAGSPRGVRLDAKSTLQSSGEIVELSFVEPAAVEASTFTSSLVQTIDASQWSPPSPDTAGITYHSSKNRLLVSDSEVNETDIYENVNLFEMSFAGDVLDTGTTEASSNSDEPTGTAYDTNTGDLFVSDDNKKEIYVFQAGSDGLYGTVDDVVTNFDTAVFNSGDPEGVAFDSGDQGTLYIADGVNSEVYKVTPGPNGIFDGTDSDDQVTSVDTFGLGLEDPEGIAFNRHTGTLYVVGKPVNTLFEITPTGDLVQTIDISPANADKPAGLAYAPGSQDSTVWNIYIAERGVDNNSDPNENDGKIYEMTLPNTAAEHPVAEDDSASTTEDTPVTIDVAANDSDPNGNLDPTSATTTCSTCSDPSNGTSVNNGDGTFTYTPDTGFTGSDSFSYEICDTEALCDTATVSITVNVNSPPTANGDSASTGVDTAVTIDVAANDSDPDGNLDPSSTNATCDTCTLPTDGTLDNNGDGTFTYTPDPGFTGSDSFVYQICDTVGACDTATATITVRNIIEVRVSAGDDDAEEQEDLSVGLGSSDLELVREDSNQTVGMRFNGIDIPQGAAIAGAYIQFQTDETDSEATSLTIQGEATDNAPTFVNTDGNISSRARTTAAVSWSPPPWTTKGEAGPDQQTPDIAPVIQEIMNRPGWSSDNSLVIIITGSGKRVAESYNGDQAGAPLLHVEYTTGPPNDPPVASDDNASTSEDTPVIIDVAANDSDPNGNLDPTSANTACPTCADPANGALVNSGDGTFDYSPNLNFNGSDSFVYEICDTLGVCATATVSLTVDPVADPPVANDDSASTSEDTPVTIDVAANDTDPDGDLDPNSANSTCANGPTGCNGAANGSLADNGDGTITYTPDPGFTVSDSFVYEICDTDPLCDTATVNITVTVANDPPVAVNDSASTSEDTPVTIDVAANDSDPDGNLDPNSANSTCANGSTGCNGAANGSLTDNGDGTITYTPNLNFNGPDSFVYEICDTGLLCDTATVKITVTVANDPPVAVNDSASTSEDTPMTIDVAANDRDPDSNLDPASANSTCANGSTGCNGAASGSLADNGDGTITYTPDPGFTGSDSFVYEICDTGLLCDTATVSITVNPSAPTILEVRVAASSDDAEERASLRVNLNSSDLELIFDREDQIVGMRFNGIDIPRGATITDASIQFQTDETDSEVTSLSIQGEATDNALTFDNTDGNISIRPRTTAAVAWSPPPWTTRGEAGPDQQTPDIASAVQEIVNRPGWSSGNSLVMIITGGGKRVAESYDGDQAGAPLLHVEYTAGPPNSPPVAVDDSASTPKDTSVNIDVVANDTDLDGNLDPASTNTSCGTCADPASGTLTNNGDGTFDYTPDPGFTGSDSFVYEICDTGLLCDTATVNITVTGPNTIRVPEDQPTIQAGIDAAQDGDLVLISPGTYFEQLILAGKTITLASQFYTTGVESFIDETIVDGQGGLADVVTVDTSVGPETKIIGITVQNGGNDGIHASAKLNILNNRFIGNNGDAIDYEDGGGVCRNNVFENNGDDAIDLDGSTEVTIDHNIIQNTGDDGIEIRLPEHISPQLTVIIRHNTIVRSAEDGIQFIGYPETSNRIFYVEHNLIKDSLMAGIGLMDEANSHEDFRGASLPDRIHVTNNTFVNNDHAITGGDNLIALNNIFEGSATLGLKNVDGDSVADYNLFWNNTVDYQNSNVLLPNSVFADPLFVDPLGSDFTLQADSLAIDVGTAFYIHNGEIVLDLQPTDFIGSAPDMGAFESLASLPVASDDGAGTSVPKLAMLHQRSLAK